MKRWLAALVGLCLTASLAHADYLMLIINVGQSQLSTPASGPGPAGMLGNRGGPGMVGAPGAMIGAPGAMIGNPAGMLGAGGRPPGAMIGASGAPPGAMIGTPGAMIGGPGAMLGAAGALGALGFQGTAPPPQKLNAQLIPICIELEHSPSLAQMQILEGGRETSLKHKWGTATLLKQSGPVVLAAMYHPPPPNRLLPRTVERFKLEQGKVLKDKGGVDRTLELAEWALSHGMHAKFEEIMDKLALEEKAHPIVLKYQTAKAELAKKLTRSPSAPWFARVSNGYEKDERSLHYTVLHRLLPADASILAARIAHLEHHYKGFYYWWVLRDQTLPMPRERLVALVTTSDDEFKHFHKGLSGGTIVFDGFNTPRENVTVLSLQPRGNYYKLLKDFSEQFFGQPGMGQPTLLKGVRLQGTAEQAQGQVQGMAIAVALKAMEESMEQASISHDCSQQLLYATGILPPDVILPEWLKYGMSSIFETPVGHPWETLGAPSPAYLPQVRELKKYNRMEANDYATLKRIVTDSYFRQAQALGKEKGKEAEKKAEEALMKAQATAWSLCYHLARKEPTKLKAYLNELARMPPDLDLDEGVLLGCFARAFGAWDSNKKKLDERPLEILARGWWNDMVAVALEAEELVQTMRSLPALGEAILAKSAK